MSIERVCPWCKGTGRITLIEEFNDTLTLLRAQARPINGASLARLAGCRGEAMANRLRVLESLGLAQGKRDGRQVLWTAAASRKRGVR